MATNTSISGKQFIKQNENVIKPKYSAYWDVNGWAIGYGNHYYEDNTLVKQGDVIDASRAEKIFNAHLKNNVEKFINNKGLSLNQNQYDAVSDLVYNIGCGNWNKSPVLRLLKESTTPRPELENAFNSHAANGNATRRKKNYELYKKKVL